MDQVSEVLPCDPDLVKGVILAECFYTRSKSVFASNVCRITNKRVKTIKSLLL